MRKFGDDDFTRICISVPYSNYHSSPCSLISNVVSRESGLEPKLLGLSARGYRLDEFY